MKDNTTQQFLDRIISEEGDTFKADISKIEAEVDFRSTLYSGLGVKILSVTGGILASLFFTGFLISADLFKSGSGMIIFGVLALGGSVILNKIIRNLTLDTAIISANIIGYISLGMGINEVSRNDNLIACVLLLISAATLFLTESFMLIFIAVIVSSGCLISFVFINDAHYFIFLLTAFLTFIYTAIHLYEAKAIARNSRINKLYTPVRTGALFSFIGLLFILSRSEFFEHHPSPPVFSSLIIVSACLVLIHKAMSTIRDISPWTKRLVYILSFLILLPSLFAPSIAGAVLILLVSFHTGHRNSIITGILVLFYAVAVYYYDLDYSLLTKSAILFFSGLLFLLVWFIFKKQLNVYEDR